MCRIFDEIRKQGIEEGRRIGLKIGERQGRRIGLKIGERGQSNERIQSC